ncbi:hypothetical protein DICA3_F22518 [Diutina catenulata]
MAKSKKIDIQHYQYPPTKDPAPSGLYGTLLTVVKLLVGAFLVSFIIRTLTGTGEKVEVATECHNDIEYYHGDKKIVAFKTGFCGSAADWQVVVDNMHAMIDKTALVPAAECIVVTVNGEEVPIVWGSKGKKVSAKDCDKSQASEVYEWS